MPTTKYEFKPNLDYLLNKSGLGHLNFEPIVGPKPIKMFMGEMEEEKEGEEKNEEEDAQ